VLVAALVGAGCGGGPRTLSKREYIDRSNALQSDAAAIFEGIDGPVATTPEEAARYLKAFDELAAGFRRLRPPRDWKDEHATMIAAVEDMREAMAIVSKASARNTTVITRQLERSTAAQRRFEQAVRSINASR